MTNWRLDRCVVAAALLLVTAACTTVEVNPLTGAPPAQSYKNVVLGIVDADDPRAAAVVPFFREGFVRRLRELNGFESVTDGAGATSPASPDTLIVNAKLTEVDKGDVVLRFLVGMGAGRERVAATITARRSDGATITSFETRKAYSGGAGIGGATLIDVEDLTMQVGEQAAQSLLDWTRGKLTKASN